jgi:hypothetical protein
VLYRRIPLPDIAQKNDSLASLFKSGSAPKLVYWQFVEIVSVTAATIDENALYEYQLVSEEEGNRYKGIDIPQVWNNTLATELLA